MRYSSCILVLVLLVGACGSSGNTGPTLFLSAPNVPAMSGFIYGPAASAQVWPSTGNPVWVGDVANDTEELGFYRFDISAIPGGSQIDEAFFRVGQRLVVGGPFSTLGGQVLIDHVELGSALDPADYTAATYATTIATLSTSSMGGQKSADIRLAVQADVDAGRHRTDLRLRFPIPTNGNGAVDDVEFNNSADAAGSGLRPILEIRYRAP